MAEGDTILRLARRLDAALAGKPLRARTPGRRGPEGRPAAELDGRTLTNAESRGKHLLLRFGDGLVLHSHLGMRGSWRIYGEGERWRKPASAAWIELAADRAVAVNFNGTSMRIVREAELRRDPRLARLGPDLLDPELTDEAATRALAGADPAAELGEALLDQSVLAGAGNVIKSEACFAAAVDPWRRLGDLDADEVGRVVSGARSVMTESVRAGRRPQRIYRRSGRPCPRCGTPIASRPQGDEARTTYWCPRCQG
jgi:endonuclease VIII